MMQLRDGCKRMKTGRCGKLTIVCQIDKLRVLQGNQRAEKGKNVDMQLWIRPIRMTNCRASI
jgi:hypothetical protein